MRGSVVPQLHHGDDARERRVPADLVGADYLGAGLIERATRDLERDDDPVTHAQVARPPT